MASRRIMRSTTVAAPQSSPQVSELSQQTFTQSTPTPSPRVQHPQQIPAAADQLDKKRSAPDLPNVNVKKHKIASLDQQAEPPTPVIDLSIRENLPKATIDFLHSASNRADWCGRVLRAVNQLFWVKRVILAKERNAIFEHFIPSHINQGVDRKACKSYFDSTMSYSLTNFRKVLEEVGTNWIGSEAGKHFIDIVRQEEAKAIKSKKGPTKFKSNIEPPASPADLLSFLGKDGLQWTKYNAIDCLSRWLIFLKTEEAPEGSIGWLLPTPTEVAAEPTATGPEKYHLQRMSNAILSSVIVYVRAEALYPGSVVTKVITASIKTEHYDIPSPDYWPEILDDRDDYSGDYASQLTIPSPYAGPFNTPDDIHEYDKDSLSRQPIEIDDDEDQDGIVQVEQTNGSFLPGDDELTVLEHNHNAIPKRMKLSHDLLTPQTSTNREEVDLHQVYLKEFEDDDKYLKEHSNNISKIIQDAAAIRSTVEIRIVDEHKKDGIFYEKISINRNVALSVSSPYLSQYAVKMASLDPLAQAAIQIDAIQHRQALIGAESFRLESENKELDCLKKKLEEELVCAYNMAEHIKDLKSKSVAKKEEISKLQDEVNSVKNKNRNSYKPSFFSSSTANTLSYGNYRSFMDKMLDDEDTITETSYKKGQNGEPDGEEE